MTAARWLIGSEKPVYWYHIIIYIYYNFISALLCNIKITYLAVWATLCLQMHTPTLLPFCVKVAPLSSSTFDAWPRVQLLLVAAQPPTYHTRMFSLCWIFIIINIILHFFQERITHIMSSCFLPYMYSQHHYVTQLQLLL